MAEPRLEIFSRDALLALCHQALGGPRAGAAGQPGAPELLRRIEQTQARLTEALKQSSAARASLGILDGKLAEGRRGVQTARADCAIHDRDNPPPPKRRLLGPKRTPEQAVQQKQREGLTARLQAAEAALAALEAEQQRVTAAADEAQKLRASTEAERRGYAESLQSSLSHEALCALLPGGAGRAAATALLEQARRIARGDPMVGLLSVLTALFGADSRSAGAHAARDMLGNLRGLFEQHSGPYERVLLAFIALIASGGEQRPSLADIGIHRPDDFAAPGLFRFYLLTRALSGLGFAAPPEALTDQYGYLLESATALSGGGSLPQAAEGQLVARRRIADAAPREADGSPPLLETVLLAGLLLAAGRPAEIPAATGIDLAALPPPKQRGAAYPSLLAVGDKLAAPAWPAETLALWRSLLALCLLCAARRLPLGGAYEQWLEQSYGWPKSAFYWRVLAWLKDDPSLLRNLPASGWSAI